MPDLDLPLPGTASPSFGDLGQRFNDLFNDADELSRLEAMSLDAVLRPHGAVTVLDCACGTGIQTIGLARLGYRMCASDISRKLTDLVARRSKAEELCITTKQSDFRDLRAWPDRHFDAVVCSGHSLSIVGTRSEQMAALRSMRRVARRGGLVIVGLRDYRVVKRSGGALLPRRFVVSNGRPEWIFDLRLFGRHRVQVVHCFLEPSGRRWRLRHSLKSYAYVSATELEARMREAGLTRVRSLDLVTAKPYDGAEWYLTVGEAP